MLEGSDDSAEDCEAKQSLYAIRRSASARSMMRTVSAVTEELTAAASSVPDMTSRPKGVPLASLYLECDGMHKKVTQETFCAWRKQRKGQSRF